MQLASIDGIKVANNPETVTIGKEEYEENKYGVINRARGPTTGISTGTYILEVNEGDIIYLYNNNASMGGTMSGNVLSVIEY